MVFKRIRDITMATIHESLDAVENPIAMLNQYLRDMEEEIQRAEQSIVKQTMIEKKFNEYKTQSQKMLDKRMRQATLAVEAGEEDLARRALSEKKQHQIKVEQYTQMTQDAHQQVMDLKEQLKEMRDKYSQMRDRKFEHISRANAARTKKQMHQAISKFDNESALKGFQRMEEKITEMETEVEVRGQGHKNSTHQRLAALEPDEDIERELTQMKAKHTKPPEHQAVTEA